MNLSMLADAALLADTASAAEPPGTGGTTWLPLLFLAVLIGVNAFFAASEIAVISLNDSKLRRMAEQHHPKAKLLVRFLDEPGRFLATIQVGITLAGFLASAFAADTFAEYFVRWFSRQPWCTLSVTALRAASVVGITLVLSFATLVFGELVPKRIAMRYSEVVAMRASRPLTFLARAMRPFVWLLNASTNHVVRLFGIDPLDNSKTVSEEEIRIMVDLGREKGVIEAAEKEMIENVFEFNNKTASAIMVHRRDIVALPLDVSPDDCRKVLRECGFSRLPVYSGSVDDIVGVLNVRDYLIQSLEDDDPALGALLRQPFFIPETIRADVLFRDMQRRKQSLAIVLDEYGGTAGLLSLEDLLEEIVGDIYDEYDEVEQQSEWEKIDENTYRINGATALGDVSELLAIDLPEDDYHTLGGMIFGRLSVIPSEGTILKLPEYGLLMTVEKMDSRRVASVVVRRVRGR